MSSKWNARPAYAEKPLLGSQISRTAALQSAASYTAVAVVAGLVSRYGLPFLSWLHVPHVTTIGAVLVCVAVVAVLAAIVVFLQWRDSNARAKAQAGLAPEQRKLLGLPPTPPPREAPPPEAAPAAARAATLLATPVTPAQRLSAVYTPVSDVAPRQLLATPGSAGRSSWTASPGARASPWSAGRAVATSDQLNRYLNQYATPTLSQQQPDGAAPGEPNGAGGGAAGGLYGGTDGDQGPAPSPGLPLGRDAPNYRPSLWPRKAVTAAGDALAPSADAAHFMQQVLRINAVAQITWIERLREWMASALLRPLAHLIMTAHEYPNQALTAMAPNSKELLLPPIPQLLGLEAHTQQHTAFGFINSGSSTSNLLALPAAAAGGLMMQAWNLTGMLAGGGAAAAAAGGGGGGRGQQQAGGHAAQQGHAAAAVGDAITRAQQMRDQLYGQQLMQGYDPHELRMALHRYAELLLLLTGRCPSDLLPPTPPSYIVNRVWQLAQSTCVKDFNWGGGGEHAGQPWTPELPSDSALLFYLFAAFVAAPGWNFPPPGAGGPDNSRGAPLYVGSAPANPPAAYSALLAYKPDKPGAGAAALVASQMASREPRFSLLLLGHQFTLCERDGFFKVLLWWLRYHLEQRQGLLGGRQLNEDAFNGLQGLLADADVRRTVSQRVFNWWYPADKE